MQDLVSGPRLLPMSTSGVLANQHLLDQGARQQRAPLFTASTGFCFRNRKVIDPDSAACIACSVQVAPRIACQKIAVVCEAELASNLRSCACCARRSANRSFPDRTDFPGRNHVTFR